MQSFPLQVFLFCRLYQFLTWWQFQIHMITTLDMGRLDVMSTHEPTTRNADPPETSTEHSNHCDENLLLWHFDPGTFYHCDTLPPIRYVQVTNIHLNEQYDPYSALSQCTVFDYYLANYHCLVNDNFSVYDPCSTNYHQDEFLIAALLILAMQFFLSLPHVWSLHGKYHWFACSSSSSNGSLLCRK